jgi:hypothetical protein
VHDLMLLLRILRRSPLSKRCPVARAASAVCWWLAERVNVATRCRSSSHQLSRLHGSAPEECWQWSCTLEHKRQQTPHRCASQQLSPTLVSMLSMASTTKSGLPASKASSASAVYISTRA